MHTHQVQDELVAQPRGLAASEVGPLPSGAELKKPKKEQVSSKRNVQVLYRELAFKLSWAYIGGIKRLHQQ